MRPRILVSWSSGKDSAWMLHRLQQRDEGDVVALLTTFDEATDSAAMHRVPRPLVEAQADAAGLPLWRVDLPWPCSNPEYEDRMRRLVERSLASGITHVAFGDLFLTDIRAYRERQLAGTGLTPLFPLWGEASATPRLAREMMAGGLSAVLVCIDATKLDGSFAGATFDAALLARLPEGIDPCGENGEFHTFCTAGPMFRRSVPVWTGEVEQRDGFHRVELLPAGSC